MKKILFSLSLVISCSAAMAQHDNLANMSAEWVRTPARNAAVDAGDAIIYNPAGVVRLNNGFHINIGNQSLFRKPTHTFDFGMGMGEKTYSQEGADPFLPNFLMSYRKDDLALFSGIYVAGGGATANYPNGSINTELIGLQSLMAAQGAYGAYDKQFMKASSYYLTSTLGLSYSFDKTFSMAIAGRYIQGNNKTNAGLTLTQSPIGLPDASFELNTTEKANGFGGVISMMLKASPRLDLTLRYETEVRLDFETTQKADDFGITQDGYKSPRDLPSVLAFGASFAGSKTVRVYADMNYYMQTKADWGTSSNYAKGENYSKLAGDAVTLALATTIQTGEKLLVSFGAGYTNFMYNDRDGYFTKPGAFETIPDDNLNLNTGFSYKLAKNVVFTCAYMHTMYKDSKFKALNASPLDVDVSVSNKLDAIALGFDLSF